MRYYSSGNSFGSFQREYPVVFNLIIANIVVFLLQNLIRPFDLTGWGAIHYWTSPLFYPHQLVTNIFFHGSFEHLLFNMVSLLVFGPMLERVWGSKKFFSFYIICGIGATIFMEMFIPYLASSFAANSGLEVSAQEAISYFKNTYSALGASGALMGVEVAVMYLFPNTEMMLMFIPVPIKLKYLIPFFIVMDIYGGFHPGDGIGHFAHLGGALVGFVLVYYWNKTNRSNFY